MAVIDLTTDSSIFGTAEDDVVLGSERGNFFMAGGGNDIIFGRGGDDTIFGGSFNGGSGDDIIFGEGGNDTLVGEYGNDILDGGAGNDTLSGDGPTNPGGPGGFSRGGGEIDILTGGAGKDTFRLEGGSIHPGTGPSYRFLGDRDYALITDFNLREDTIRLATIDTPSGSTQAGVAVEYSLGASPDGLPPGTAIFVNNLGATPDVIGILLGVQPNSVSLSAPYFQFVSDY